FFGGYGPPEPGGRGFIRRVDIGRLLSEDAIELLRTAVQKAAEWGAEYLDSEHLLWAATRFESIRTLLEQAGADPDGIARTIESCVERKPARQGRMPLSPSV